MPAVPFLVHAIYFGDCNIGANETNRTSDLLITNQLLYRLSYVGNAVERATNCSQFEHY